MKTILIKACIVVVIVVIIIIVVVVVVVVVVIVSQIDLVININLIFRIIQYRRLRLLILVCVN